MDVSNNRLSGKIPDAIRAIASLQNAIMSTNLSGPVLRATTRLSQRYPPISRYGGSQHEENWVLSPSPYHAHTRCNTTVEEGYPSDMRDATWKQGQKWAIPPLRCHFKNQGALKGTNLRGQTEPKRGLSQIFADFCRFSPFPRKQSIWETQIFAENR